MRIVVMARRAALMTLLLLATVAWAVPARAQADPAAIKAWVGMYPHDRLRGLTFLEDPEVQTRVINALGPSAVSQIKDMATVGPILQRGDWLIAYGCRPHMCADAKWWVAINLTSFETRACLALLGSPTVRFGASGKKYIDLPRAREGACPEPEKTIPMFDQLLGGPIASEKPKASVTLSFGAPPPIALNKNWTRVPLKKEGGTFGVPIEINGALTLEFVVDSGAADVSVPVDVFSTLIRTGTIKDSDIIGEETYVLADGSKSKLITFTIRSLKVGDKVVENVKGSVASSHGILLLGQSFLERFKSWSVDNVKHELLLERE
jgi:clan AA aspartic protease (TIGR02281 family)